MCTYVVYLWFWSKMHIILDGCCCNKYIMCKCYVEYLYNTVICLFLLLCA